MNKVSLKQGVAGLEDAIIVLSGPALAISGIIAGVDLVTGGNILRSMPQFTLAWAITLLLSLDFNILALGVRAHRVYSSNNRRGQKVLEILLMVAIAAAISYVSIQMQSIIARVSAEGITIDQAAAQMGVNLIALTWERSTLVLVLIFMSGWLREHDTANPPAPVQAAAPAPITPPLDELIDRLDARYHERMEALYQRTVETVRISIEQATNPQLPALPAPENSLNTFQERAEARESQQPLLISQFASKEQAVARALQERPLASVEEVAQEAQCSVKTAAKWAAKYKEKEHGIRTKPSSLS